MPTVGSHLQKYLNPKLGFSKQISVNTKAFSPYVNWFQRIPYEIARSYLRRFYKRFHVEEGEKMNDLSNYYCRSDFNKYDYASSERFPANHVRPSALLKPVQWVDNVYSFVGTRAFKSTQTVLKAFDSAAPFDKYLGTPAELKQVRNAVQSFCQGIDNNPFLTSGYRFINKKTLVGYLESRKKVLEYYHENKEFIEANGKIKAPVLITGMPRSGTTLLQRLMSEDPNTRSPYTFELETPLPPMTADADPLKDPRIEKSNSAINTVSRLLPGFIEKFSESHLWSPTEKEESFLYMLTQNGVSVMSAPNAGKKCIDNYRSIEFKRPILRYERIFFTMLDAYRPAKSHWTLKAPAYAQVFPLLFETYPDVRIVVTHRNPLITMPSVCRLLESWCIAGVIDGTFDKHRFAQLAKLLIEQTIEIPFTFRKEHPEKENQIFDCMYESLFTDPIALVRDIYRKFDLEYTEEFEKRMRIYLENNKQGKYGRHKYSLEEYGLEKTALYEEYQEYMNQYGYGIPDKIIRPSSFNFGLGSKSDKA